LAKRFPHLERNGLDPSSIDDPAQKIDSKKSEKSNFNFFQNFCGQRGSKGVDHLPLYPKVKGSIPAAATDIGREKQQNKMIS
jgi:hypothetical protein